MVAEHRDRLFSRKTDGKVVDASVQTERVEEEGGGKVADEEDSFAKPSLSVVNFAGARKPHG